MQDTFKKDYVAEPPHQTARDWHPLLLYHVHPPSTRRISNPYLSMYWYTILLLIHGGVGGVTSSISSSRPNLHAYIKTKN
jgi:hypothetical protein